MSTQQGNSRNSGQQESLLEISEDTLIPAVQCLVLLILSIYLLRGYTDK